jgi:Domain of unknown function (DUF3516)
VRAEMHLLLHALAHRDFEAASACVANPEDWDADRIEAEFAPLYAGGDGPRADPEARKGHWTRIEERTEKDGPLRFDVIQTLIDAEGEGDAQLEAEVELGEAKMPAGPMLRLRGLRG